MEVSITFSSSRTFGPVVELGLRIAGKVSDLVEEEGRAIGELEDARPMVEKNSPHKNEPHRPRITRG
jgi:hypothetical protein